MTGARAYARTQSETASKERLMVLLFQAALRDVRNAASSLENRRAQEATASLEHASEIVAELLATLDHSRAPDLCQKLSDVYQFVLDRLLRAQTDRDPRLAREAERAFEPLVLGFAEAVQKIESGAAEAAAR